MKKIAFVLAAMVLMTAATYADDAVEKLGRGTANVITSPCEMSQQMGRVTEEKGPIAGLTWGTFQGAVSMVQRAAVGAFEMATFPLPIPKNYSPVLTDPEYFMQEKDRGRL
jgi:putative exosortase-associated protein (TIGR04073 family)